MDLGPHSRKSCPACPADKLSGPSQGLSVKRSDGPFAGWLRLVLRTVSKNYPLGHLIRNRGQFACLFNHLLPTILEAM